MGSTSTTTMLLYCIALSMVAVGLAMSGAADSPVRFEHARGIGSVIRSCRGVPSAEWCCGAFKAFACPYSDLLNDNAENGCASDMFFEINVRVWLHPSLFSQLCVEGPLGLQCI
ncbi:GPI-anchored protein LLG1-like [Setaria viridis]|uniref:GPI-anchored protein LLG1-like n=1 Tax=Setaria viridis TaxID=4556 RepID=UPI0014933246|nr:GPI-anchored protein LLG1-like [Setaria viridis]